MNAMTVLKNVVFKPAGLVGFQAVADIREEAKRFGKSLVSLKQLAMTP
jgi:hypothetical protein